MEVNVRYQELFQNGQIVFLAKVIAFLNRKNTYNYIARANFMFNIANRVSPKINFKTYLLLQFLRLILETWNLCSRNLNKNPSKMGSGNLQNSIFSLLRPKSKFWSLESFVSVSRT